MNSLNIPNYNGRLVYIEYIRLYALISLIAWHSLCIYLGWNVLSNTPEIEDSFLTKIYKYVAQIFIPNANMPLFTAISGFVYSYLYNCKGKYRDFRQVLQSKVKRLVIPYIILGPIVVMTIFDWELISIVKGEAHHLWYCLMLFWCFVFIQIYHRLNTFFKILVVFTSVALQYKHITIPIPGMNHTVDLFAYFLWGYYLPYFLDSIKKWYILVFLVLCYALTFFVNTVFPAHVIRGYLIISLLFSIVPVGVKSRKWVTVLSQYSFGIYVFHEWFLWNMAHIKHVQLFAINHQLLYPVFAFIFVFLLSTLLTHYSLKTKIGKYLLS